MKKIILTSLCLAFGLAPVVSEAQKSKKDKHKKPVAQAVPPKAEKATVESKTKSCKKKDGLFALYQDTVNGKVYILVKKDQIGKEYIYFSYSENGVSAVGANRGSYRDNKVFRINKYFENIEFEQRNTNFYFDPTNNLSKSAEANIAPAILASEKIVAGDDKSGYLLDADELFLSEKLQQIKPSPFPGAGGMGFQLGMLSRNKTRFRQMSNYPENTDLVVDYAFDNPYPMNYGDNDVTDARSVTVTIQHTIIEMPKNNFVPRFDDPRVGYFSEQVDNQTSKGAVNYRDLIHRWNLEKKDKSLAVSDPLKPITWWIEKTTPQEYRETIKQAGLQWNKAFEAAGFSNAIKIEIQPDTATWDAGDIRYNVLRWTSSPNPPFGGYGPSFVNPRTGEILGADIMFEYIFVTNREARQKLFETAMSTENIQMPCAANHLGCDAQLNFHQQGMFGQQVLASQGARLEDKNEMIRQSLYYLILHEMGHTMGLMHNMKASQIMSPEQVLSPLNNDQTDIIGSVMDYPALNLPLKAGDKVKYCQTQPGPYDMWAIKLGYANLTDDEFEATLRQSTKPELTFGNDADDMRSAGGGGIDPRVNVNDLSGDAITYSVNRIAMVKETMKGIKEKYTPGNETYQELVNAFYILYGEHAGAGTIISRYIGGVYVDRSAVGTPNTQPLTPVAYADQKRAMKVLNDFMFAPDAFAYPAEIASFLQQQRRGFGFFGNGEDPKFHDRVIAAQANIFNQVLSPVVLKRLTDTRIYGNKYAVNEMVSDLTRSVFSADLQTDVNTFRQNLQTLYVNRLIMVAGLNDKMPSMGYDNISKATAYNALVSIKASIKTALGGNKETKDHRNYMVFLIDQALTK